MNQSFARKSVRNSLFSALICGTLSSAAFAASASLPDENQSSLLTATVSEQAQVSVPANIAFTVSNTSLPTDATIPASVTIDHIAVNEGKHLRVSLQANAASFAQTGASGTMFSASDVSWDAASWSGTGSTGSVGSLDDLAYTVLVDCGDAVATCSTTDLQFTLAANAAVTQAGAQTLTMTYKFESI